MKVLFIGGTGNISTPVSKLALDKGIELFHLNRGKTKIDLPGVKSLQADINDSDAVSSVLKGHTWDVVVNWIAFKPDEIQRDYNLFKDTCKQYIFISSASAYQKPPAHPVITESTPLYNPYWDYSRDKIACEELLNTLYREKNFPISIVRPSHTYDTVIPVAIGSWTDYTIIDRMKKGKPIIIHGDGTSLWTLTHARDFAKGFVGLMGHQQAIGQAFHITSDELLTWNQIYEAVAEAAGTALNAVHISSYFICETAKKHEQTTGIPGGFMMGNLLGDKAQSVIFDNTKIKTYVPEFVATIPFRKGIKETIDWFEADKSRMIIDDSNNRFLDVVIEEYQRSGKK
ncbi:MAG: SDR family oxidoreductase [Bacteroidota bacterium]